VIPTRYNDLHRLVDCVDAFIQVVQLTVTVHIGLIRAVVEWAHLEQENAALGCINSISLLNNHVDLDTYSTVYSLEYLI